MNNFRDERASIERKKESVKQRIRDLRAQGTDALVNLKNAEADFRSYRFGFKTRRIPKYLWLFAKQLWWQIRVSQAETAIEDGKIVLERLYKEEEKQFLRECKFLGAKITA